MKKRTLILILVAFSLLLCAIFVILKENSDFEGDDIEIEILNNLIHDLKNPDVDTDIDSDGDGIPDYFEEIFETEPNQFDTDGDGLPDSIELLSLLLSPLSKDTDENGLEDGYEDTDSDGLANLDEYQRGIDIANPDTDGDGLSDGDEINLYGTNPLLADTDSDGVDDAMEIAIDSNPSEENYSFNRTYEYHGISNKIKAAVHLGGLNAAQVNDFFIAGVTSGLLADPKIPGYIDMAFTFSEIGDFDSATVSIELDSSLFENESFSPALYWYDEENQLLIKVPEQQVLNNVVSCELSHFSDYILLNSTEQDEVWDIQIPFGDPDLILDSDGDGIYDYYEKELANGTLRLGTGVKLTGIDYQDPDSDNDGLKDGSELKIQRSGNRVYVYMCSNPLLADTDGDGIDDADDHNPLVKYVSEILLWQSLNKPGYTAMKDVSDNIQFDDNGDIIYEVAEDMRCNDQDEASLIERQQEQLASYAMNTSEAEMWNKFYALLKIGVIWPIMELLRTPDNIANDVFILTAAKEMAHHFRYGDGTPRFDSAFTKAIANYRESRLIQVAKATDESDGLISESINQGIHKLIDWGFLSKSVFSTMEQATEFVTSRLSNNNGNLSALAYDVANLEKPGTATGDYKNSIDKAQFAYQDTFNGFGILIHDFHGYTATVHDYQFDGDTFSGKIHFQYYDHFGLDHKDHLELSGFRDWYCLQHMKRFEGKYKPFVNYFDFEDIEFSGTVKKEPKDIELSVTGKTTDQHDTLPIQGAIVKLYKKLDDTEIASAKTNSRGIFRFNKIPVKYNGIYIGDDFWNAYYLTIQKAGYESDRRINSNLSLIDSADMLNNSYNLGDINLAPTKELLSQNRYNSYLSVIEEYEKLYGAVNIEVSESGYSSWLTGLCFVSLIDFDMDGIEELLLVYRNPGRLVTWSPSTLPADAITDPDLDWGWGCEGMTDDYSFSVYGYDGKNAVKLCEETGLSFSLGDVAETLDVISRNGLFYIWCGTGATFDSYDYFYGLADGEFKIAHYELLIDVDSDVDPDSEEGPGFFYCEVDGQQYKNPQDWYGNVSKRVSNPISWKFVETDDDPESIFSSYNHASFPITSQHNNDDDVGMIYADVVAEIKETKLALLNSVRNRSEYATDITVKTDGDYYNLPLGLASEFSTGSEANAVISAEGELYSWYVMRFPQAQSVLHPNWAFSLQLPEVEQAKAVSVGGNSISACISEDGSLYTWGAKFFRDSLREEYLFLHGDAPTKVDDLSHVVSVATGGYSANHFGAVTESGNLYMWGNNEYGQLGDGTYSDHVTPQRVDSLQGVKFIALGGERSAAITDNGDLYLWGSRSHLNKGYFRGQNLPTKIEGLPKVKYVSLGITHIAAITEDGDLYTWGESNEDGQLGDMRDSAYAVVPTRIEGLSNVKYVSLGHSHSIAITENGDLYTWGKNEKGQLGDGTQNSRYMPQRILGVSNVAYISAESNRSAAVTEDGDVYIWGAWNPWYFNAPKNILTPMRVSFQNVTDIPDSTFNVLTDDRSGQIESADTEYQYYNYYEYALLDESVKNSRLINAAIIKQKESFFELENPKATIEEHLAEYGTVYTRDFALETAVNLKDAYLDEQYFSLNLLHMRLSGTGMVKYIGSTYDLETGDTVTLPDVLGMNLDETKDFVWKHLKPHISAGNDTDSIWYDNAESSLREKKADELAFCIKGNGAVYLLCSKYEYESGAAGAKEVFLTLLTNGKEQLGAYSNSSDLLDHISEQENGR